MQQSQNQGLINTWNYREIIKYKSENETNALIISLLGAGAESFLIEFSGVFENEIQNLFLMGIITKKAILIY